MFIFPTSSNDSSSRGTILQLGVAAASMRICTVAYCAQLFSLAGSTRRPAERLFSSREENLPPPAGGGGKACRQRRASAVGPNCGQGRACRNFMLDQA